MADKKITTATEALDAVRKGVESLFSARLEHLNQLRLEADDAEEEEHYEAMIQANDTQLSGVMTVIETVRKAVG